MNAPMLAATLTAASQNGPHIPGGSKAGAILIGVLSTEASPYLIHRIGQALGGRHAEFRDH